MKNSNEKKYEASVCTGRGTLGRFAKQRPLVRITLNSNGYGPECNLSQLPESCWSWMTAAEARRLAQRLIKAAARAEAKMSK